MHFWASVNVVMDATIRRNFSIDFLKSSLDSSKLASSQIRRKFCNIRRAGWGTSAVFLLVLFVASLLPAVLALAAVPLDDAAAAGTDDDDEFFGLLVVPEDDLDEPLAVDFGVSLSILID
jgi:hypothetical protein